ncbi:MAG: peptidylprolyl isomerase [Candidatus Marinimicrobia bacterium]|nr:peptidylprolyl isomerase [Candidatus Neomarinimicrobiota bacterium]
MTIHMAGDRVAAYRLRLWAASSAAGLLLAACGPTEVPPEQDILATIGDRTITVASFRRAMLPQILYFNSDDTPQSRTQLLQALIDQKILAREAQRLHFDTALVVRRAAKAQQRQAMAGLLYRHWVQQWVPAPTEDDLWQAFVRGQTRLLVRHLAVESEQAADSLRRLLISGTATFDHLARGLFDDARLRDTGGLMGWVTYGDLDENLENAIFDLRPGEISTPVESLYGWHILRVDDARRSAAFDSLDFKRQRDNLETKVYRRWEFRLGTQVLNDYMRAQNVQFDQEVATRLWAILKPQLRGLRQSSLINSGPPVQFSSPTFGIEEAFFLDLVLVEFEGGSWTVGTLLERLPEMRRRYLTGNLYTGTAYLIRDELLARQGLDRKYDRDPDVIRQVQDRKDEVMAQLYLAALIDTVAITPQMVRRFYDDQWQRRYYGPDSLRIEAISAESRSAAERLLLSLRQGAPFDEITQQAGNVASLTGDLGWQVAGRTRYPALYHQGLRTKLMVPTGPVKTDAGWTIIRVTERRRYPAPFDEIKEQVQMDLERELADVARRQALAKLAPHIDIKVDQQRLQSLSWGAGES